VRLLREGAPPLRVGHRGAAALAPPNTLTGLEAALAAGLDGVEVDVVAAEGRLSLAHSLAERTGESPSLDDALAFLAERAPAGFLLDLDVKGWGFEAALVAALRRHGLVERTLVSSFFAQTVRMVRAIEPALETAISYPYDRLGVTGGRVPEAAIGAGLAVLRRGLPLRIGRMLRQADARAATLHHLVVSRALVARCHALGVPVLAWTVNDVAALERIVGLGVDGVITDDPRIFGTGAGIAGNGDGVLPV
jgi:glycerophosphoryl diester phosphodiesterase